MMPFSAAMSNARNDVVTHFRKFLKVFQVRLRGVSSSFKGVSRVFERSFNGISGSFKEVSRMFEESSRVFQGRLKKISGDISAGFKGICKKGISGKFQRYV